MVQKKRKGLSHFLFALRGEGRERDLRKMPLQPLRIGSQRGSAVWCGGDEGKVSATG